MEALFPQLHLDTPEAPEPAGRRAFAQYALVASERGIDKLLTYGVPIEMIGQLMVGQRVRVPLGRGNKVAFGVVASLAEATDVPGVKAIAAIADERVLVTPELMMIALWISSYYVTPLGVVLENMIPSAVKKHMGVRAIRMVRVLVSPEELQAKLETCTAKKRRSVLARLLQVEPGTSIELVRLAGESGVKTPTIVKLAKAGLIRIEAVPRLGPAIVESPLQSEEPPRVEATVEQAIALETILPALEEGFSVNLLHGVTGSGKTEVYLRAIEAVVKAGKSAVVLVPEIALTPQTVKRFTQRFNRVAIMHSGLAGPERHRQWQQVADGRAQVVVGARSAVFAPVAKLGLIVVDEEHESSYKQDQAPRYHARDAAIMRGKFEGAMVLLGSATPSLEMYHRAAFQNPRPSGTPDGRGQGEGPAANRSSLTLSPHPNLLPTKEGTGSKPTYRLITMADRVRGVSLPTVELIDMRIANRQRKGVHLLSQKLETSLTKTIAAGEQAILLLNRRGYSNFIYCASCQEAVQCKYCDTTMTYHRGAGLRAADATSAQALHTGQMHCHYCLAVNPLPAVCPTCGKKLSLFGLGTQRVEEEIARKFPTLRFARVDSDTMRGSRDYEKLLAAFAAGEIQMLLGTQMIAKGLDYPNVTLVGVISGDTALSLPDFRASERTFQLITQVAGRAGRGTKPGRVLLQTFVPDDPTIRAAMSQDYVRFASEELERRKDVSLPPYSRLARIVLRDQDENKLFDRQTQLEAMLQTAIARHGDVVELRGPMPCAISRIAGYFRSQALLIARRPRELQVVLAELRKGKGLVSGDRIAIDVDPVSLL